MHMLRVPQPTSPSLPNSFKPQRLQSFPTSTCISIPSTTHNTSPARPPPHDSTATATAIAITTTKNSRQPSLSTSQPKRWNSRIQLHLQNGNYQQCISLYYQMLDEHITPTQLTFVLVLKACSSLSDLKTLRILHNDILRYNLESHGGFTAALLNGYLKCGSPEMALQLFDKMRQRDVVSWTVIISHFYKRGQHGKAMHCFREMIKEGVYPDEISLVCMLSSSTCHGCLRHGMEVHGYLTRMDFNFSKATTSSLVNMYAKHGKMEYADQIVCRASKENVAAWTVMIMGLVRAHDEIGALMMYEKMVSSGIQPTEKTITCALRAVCHLGSLRLGAQIHGYIIKRQFQSDKYILSSLIDMYATCGAPTHLCVKLFNQMVDKDVVPWTAMISACGKRGEGVAALQLFHDMLVAGVRPDSVAFTAILSACCSSSMLCEGIRFFHLMIRDYGIEPREEHYACLKGLIAKDAKLQEAYEGISNLDLSDDVGTWEAFLGACRIHGNVRYGEIAARKLLEIEPSNCSAQSMLSHVNQLLGDGRMLNS